MTATFKTAPDVFYLRLPAGEKLTTILPYMSPFGETDELLCHVEGTLIGQLVKQGESATQFKFIHLLPKLDSARAYEWPSSMAFTDALLRLLRELPAALLLCEADAEQQEIGRLSAYAAVTSALARVVRYCEGSTQICPSFFYTRENVEAPLSLADYGRL